VTAESGVRWIGDLDETRRRQFRRVVLWSAGAHLAAILLAAFMPAPSTMSVPAAVTVDLVAAAPSARPAAPPKPKAAPAPAPKPAEAPKPKPKAPVEKTVVLPKEARDPKPKPAPKEEPRPQERSYADIMKDLKAKADDTEVEEETPAPAQVASLGTSNRGSARGIRVDAATAAWMRDARIHVRKSWVLAPGFRTEDLATELSVRLDDRGNVIGEPEIVRRSGNPWYDDSVVRAIQKASPLPAPPEAGEWPFIFRPEEVL
jgi:TonB family protein